MSKPSGRRFNGMRIALIVLCVILSLILAVLVFARFYIPYLYNKMEFVGEEATVPPEFADQIALEDMETIDPDSTENIINEEDITFMEEDVTHEGQGEHIYNFMLVGQDAREGETTQRSDSMMLVTFNTYKNTITLTSIMRDQYVKIPGYGRTKLNHSYQYGGMSLLNQTIYNHFGVEIDGNFEVDFTGFEKIIDRLGGVDINLTAAEVKYLKTAGFSYVKEGMNHLPGDCALLYSRLRSIDTDYARAERQRNVMMSLFEAYKDLSSREMLALLHELLPMLRTNMSMTEIVNYAVELYPMLSDAQIDTLRIPVDGTFQGGYVKVSEGLKLWCQYNIDFEANRKVLEKIFDEA